VDTPLFGVDVSEYQHLVDWPALAASGIGFAVCRASLGTGYTDPTFARNVPAARGEDLVVGAYHYLYPGDGALQADAFLAVAWDGQPLVCVVDVEQKGVSIDDLRAFSERFAEKVPNHPLVVYTGGWYWRGHMGDPAGADLGPLWESRYVQTGGAPDAVYAEVPAAWWTPGYGGWPQATLLQFSSAGHVPGVHGRCDLDAFLGDADALRALTLAPAVVSATTVVNATVTPWAATRTGTLAAAVTSYAASTPYGELGSIGPGTFTCDADVVIDAPGDPTGAFVRVETGPVGRRLVPAASIVLSPVPPP
jgi:GH25 family lysozyme M1 (1,4-beta-N-acetylmuramidase)